MFAGMIVGMVLGGIAVVVLAVAGVVHGALDGVRADPEVKARRELERAEEHRRGEWRRKRDGG